jgi:drug/metabolite transporter (DMT)-like permease
MNCEDCRVAGLALGPSHLDENSGSEDERVRVDRNAGAAIGAAVLFGLSTPLAKELVGEVPPLLLAGLLYLGSGLGLLLLLGIRVAAGRQAGITWPRGADVAWLLGAILAGGAIGPFLLMFGLRQTDAASASLILNLEGVFTALLAWFVFKENFDRRIAWGMAAIVAGGVVLSAGPAIRTQGLIGPFAIAAACLAWAIDNNLTRKVSIHDAMLIACLKGLVAGGVSVALALASGALLPARVIVLEAGLLGFVGYGLSLTLFVVALRGLGTARTGAYFSLAPFLGASFAVALGGSVTAPLLVAAVLMGIGVWFHLTEHHEHTHRHTPIKHDHWHVHDEHHQHRHLSGQDVEEPHSHEHVHEPIRHAHAHYPDIHHRHEH